MNKLFTLRATAIAGTLLATTIIGIGINPILSQLQQQSAYAWVHPDIDPVRNAAIATDGNNIYIVWFNDKGTPNKNGGVMFRASTDKGQTFGDKINLSNTTNADSTRVGIDSDANSVVVTWWETNQTSDMPVMKISTDNGKTFGPLLKLAANGTIGSSAGG